MLFSKPNNHPERDGLADIGAGGAALEQGDSAQCTPSARDWKEELKRALAQHAKQPHSRYVQIATSTKDGIPSCRTVVFRGFSDFLEDRERGTIKFITDLRSSKVADVDSNPYCEVCWYFDKTREQFRIRGELRLVKFDEVDGKLAKARISQWKNLSDNARIQFAWPFPGAERKEEADDEIDFNPPLPDSEHPLDTFCLLLLYPTSVDHLQLRGNPQRRDLYEYAKIVDASPSSGEKNPDDQSTSVIHETEAPEASATRPLIRIWKHNRVNP